MFLEFRPSRSGRVTELVGADIGRAPRILSALASLIRFKTSPRAYFLWRRLFRQQFTLLHAERAIALAGLAKCVDELQIPGCIVDCGVWRGGSTAILATSSPERPVWAFDSFEGLPRPGAQDGGRATKWEGELKASEDDVREALRTAGVRLDRVKISPGWFQDTLPTAATGPIALLHCDGDWFESVSAVLNILYPRMSPGGIVVIDDYGEWQGAHVATDSFLERLDPRPSLIPIDQTGRYFQKISL